VSPPFGLAKTPISGAWFGVDFALLVSLNLGLVRVDFASLVGLNMGADGEGNFASLVTGGIGVLRLLRADSVMMRM
jgi:hypothetical protein